MEIQTTETPKPNQLAILITESGLEKSKGQVLLEKFNNYFEIAAEWERKAKELVITDVSQTHLMAAAREARLLLKRKRTEIENTRKLLKEDSIREGKSIDSIATILKNLIEPIENDLEAKEKFAEYAEAKQKEKLNADRLNLLLPYNFQYHNGFRLGEMDEEMFNSLLTGTKIAFETKQANEAKAEEERIAKVKSDSEEKERLRLENERLKKESEIKAKRNNELRPFIVFIRDYNKMVSLDEISYQKEFANIKIAANQHYQYEAKKKNELDKENENLRIENEKQVELRKQERIRDENAQLAIRKKAAEDKKALEDKAISDKKLADEALAKTKQTNDKLMARVNRCQEVGLTINKEKQAYAFEDISISFENIKTMEDAVFTCTLDQRKKLIVAKKAEEDKVRAKAKADMDAKLAKEKADRMKLQKELKDIREAEEEEAKRIADEAKAKAKEEKKLRLAPDKEKLKLFATELLNIKFPIVKSEEAQFLIDGVKDSIQELSKDLVKEANDMD